MSVTAPDESHQGLVEGAFRLPFGLNDLEVPITCRGQRNPERDPGVPVEAEGNRNYEQ